MTTKTKASQIAKLETEAKEIAATVIMVATNEGTYSAIEAQRAIGTGDPAYADRKVYERIGDGVISSTGPSEDDAPGRMRQINSEAVNQLRAKLRSLREQIKAAR